jgi:hypothetical protein
MAGAGPAQGLGSGPLAAPALRAVKVFQDRT